jgi:glycine betaine/proline transport system permease protein
METSAVQSVVRDAQDRVPPDVRMEQIRRFAGRNSSYYQRAFTKIETAGAFAVSFNGAAALFGPFWMAARNVWPLYWPSVLMETIAYSQMVRGLFGKLGAEEWARAEQLARSAAERAQQAREAAEQGSPFAAQLAENAKLLADAATAAQKMAEAQAAGGGEMVLIGLILVIVAKLGAGLLANAMLERRFLQWRTDRSLSTGIDLKAALWGGAVASLMIGLTAFRTTVTSPDSATFLFPAASELRAATSRSIAEAIQGLARSGEQYFDAIKHGIRALLDVLELALVWAPWPVVATAILTLAWRLAGLRAALWTAVGLAYLLTFGFWQASMSTVALLGTAALLCVAIGLPLGIWFAKSKRAYAVARPVLDFMQTMPSFVYLIPVIAFFGTGKPPAILATIVFGMPPVIRLTALGLRGVPASVLEAVDAFGANKWYRLSRVELPLALPSIMTGINQTILMCLSMVVIASLIGAKGLGEEV